MKFQVGDKVRCIMPDDRRNLRMGEIYEVVSGSRSFIDLKRGDGTTTMGWMRKRFEAVEKRNPRYDNHFKREDYPKAGG